MGSAELHGSGLSRQTCKDVIRRWNEQSKQTDFSKFLPMPMTAVFRELKNANGQPMEHPYTAAIMATGEFSKSGAGMLQGAISIALQPQAVEDETHGTTLELVLVPPGKTEKGTIADPFYLATIETTFGMMRCYRDGARAVISRDPELAGYFDGKLETQSIQQNDRPYQLSSIGEAFEFCNWLSYIDGFQPVYHRESEGGNWTANFLADGFRLPTSQEWEYSARLGIDWYQSPGGTTWHKIWADLDKEHADSVVWFYYKKEARPFRADGRFRYPVGAYDLCGNMGELAMNNAKWQKMEKERTGMVVCGGNFKHRTADKVMPWSVEEFDTAENVGFRVILPVRIDRLLK